MRKKIWYTVTLIWEGKEEVICKVRSERLAHIIVNQLRESIYKEPVYKLKIT